MAINKLKDIRKESKEDRIWAIGLLIISAVLLITFGLTNISILLGLGIMFATLFIGYMIDKRYWDLKYYIMKKK